MTTPRVFKESTLRIDVNDRVVANNRKKYISMLRKCLKCGDSFKSEWSGNRICEKCGKRNSYVKIEEYGILL